MPLYAIYKIYELRILQVEKLKRLFPNGNCSHLRKIQLSNMERERVEMKKRLIELDGEDLNDLDTQEFDEKIKSSIKNLKSVYDERAIKADFSYNLAHFDEYRSYAISNYKS